MEHYLYLFLNLASISVPLVFSFDRRVDYAKRWKHLFRSMAIVGGVFIIWDVLFTRAGIWGFNDEYLVGFRVFGLPIEEWMFFFAIPFASIFIYDVSKYFFPRLKGSFVRPVTFAIVPALVILALVNLDRLYTSITFLLTSGLIILAFVRYRDLLERFYRTYIIVLIPFLLVNGTLTGWWIQDEVVWYNNDYNLGLRIGSIPIEDTFYGMSLLLWCTMLYEGFTNKALKKSE
ncbi:MAG TPA: lycopene cyclase domain-containing protein [Flavobacteriales bacterium]|jgi:lycopene cyclase domain-containing protein|nr:lycopene cyclase domain-containing protein [Flavobacteriales bacterium]